MGDLSGKVILVTGGSKGIGAATVRVLGDQGASVIVHYGRDEAGARAAAAAIPDERCAFIAADMSDCDAADRLWAEAVAWQGRVDVLINNAAVMHFGHGIDDTPDDWDAVFARNFQVNVFAPGRLLRAATRTFLDAGGGAIVTISSWAAQRGTTNPDMMAYGASKAAVRNMTQTIARGYARHNVLAYVIAPGVVRTQMSLDFAASQGGEDAVSAGLAMGEWVTPEDVAETAAFLASGKARHLSGATIDINGASYVR